MVLSLMGLAAARFVLQKQVALWRFLGLALTPALGLLAGAVMFLSGPGF